MSNRQRNNIENRILRSLLIIALAQLSGNVFSQNYFVDRSPLYTIKVNPTKLISNELTLSFELKYLRHGYEIELGYIYPTSNPSKLIPSYGIENLGIPLLQYSGGSTNLYYKYYFNNHFYIGGQLLYKYMFFNNKWLYTGGMSDEGENTLCSQTKNVIGLGFRCGFMGTLSLLIIEPYYSIGLKEVIVTTKYDSYNKNGSIHYGTPPHTLSKDNGLYTQFFINFGVKIGICWPKY